MNTIIKNTLSILALLIILFSFCTLIVNYKVKNSMEQVFINLDQLDQSITETLNDAKNNQEQVSPIPIFDLNNLSFISLQSDNEQPANARYSDTVRESEEDNASRSRAEQNYTIFDIEPEQDYRSYPDDYRQESNSQYCRRIETDYIINDCVGALSE